VERFAPSVSTHSLGVTPTRQATSPTANPGRCRSSGIARKVRPRGDGHWRRCHRPLVKWCRRAHASGPDETPIRRDRTKRCGACPLSAGSGGRTRVQGEGSGALVPRPGEEVAAHDAHQREALARVVRSAASVRTVSLIDPYRPKRSVLDRGRRVRCRRCRSRPTWGTSEQGHITRMITIPHSSMLHHTGAGRRARRHRMLAIVDRLRIRLIIEGGDVLRRPPSIPAATTSPAAETDLARCRETCRHDVARDHDGAPGRIRTCGLGIRSPLLCPG
jgi:hypothetical protein